MNRKLLGKTIKLYRKKAGLTQAELAKILGTSNIHISHIEIGAVTPSVEVLLSIAEVLHVTPNDLFVGNYALSEKAEEQEPEGEVQESSQE
jgi:transcriptional regulator with XRE-family HTH domain